MQGYTHTHLPLVLQSSVHEVEIAASPFEGSRVLGVVVQLLHPVLRGKKK